MSFSAQKKLLIIQRVKNGTSIASLSREQGVSRKTIYAWIHRYEHARTKAKQYAFQPKNPKGVDHWKAISTLEERKILRTIIKNPKLSLRSLAKATLLSAHAVWNFLERNNLHAFEQRIRYIQNNEIKILHEKTSAQKLAIIALVKSGENVSAVCKQFGMSRKTFYKWYRRYQISSGREDGVVSKRRKGEKHWRYKGSFAKIIHEIIIKYPQYGVRAISNQITYTIGKKIISAHGVYAILKRMELNKYEFRVAYAKTYGRNFGVIGSGVIESYISPYDFTGRLEALEEKNNWNFLYGIAVMGIIALVITNVLLIRSILRERLILQSPQTNIIPVKISPQSLIAVQEKIYTVISGDDLWHIAEKFYASGYHWIIIARENNLKNPGLLIIGQKLFIPAITNQMRTKVIEGKYIVQKGDDLWGIAVLVYQNGYKWVEIAHANHIHNPGLIYPGEILHIPKD